MNLTSLQIKRELLNSLWKVVPRTTSLTLGGVRMKVPLGRELDRRVLTLKHEPWMAGLLERILRVKKGGLVDVGANAGQTLLRYKSLFPKGTGSAHHFLVGSLVSWVFPSITKVG